MLILVLSVAIALIAPTAASAAGKTYEVVQCDFLNRGVSGVDLDDAPAYAARQMCGDPHNDHAIKITNTRFARHGRSGRARWSTGSPSLRIVGAEVRARLRRSSGHVPRLFVADTEGHELARVAAGVSHATGFRTYAWHSPTANAEQFVAHLRCERQGGCQHSDLAKTWLKNVHFRVADTSDPRLSAVVGSLLQAGWLRGVRGMSVQAVDGGSGLRWITVSVNGAVISSQAGNCSAIAGTAYASEFSACESDLALNAQIATAGAPIHDGRNLVSICGIDFAGNRTCVERKIHVDNTKPEASFSNAQLREDPELIRASVADSTSGISDGRIYYRAVGTGAWRPLTTELRVGSLRTRIDSTQDPPGPYEFMAWARDGAGNRTYTTKRENGKPMVLNFPLKSGVQLKGHLSGGSSRLTVGYGRSAKATGRLVDASGAPLANQDVIVTEYFGEGALIDRRVRTVQTNARGRWKERLPRGPSRRLTASYAGTRRYLPDTAHAGNLHVKTKTTLHLSRRHVREGKRVAFKGRVRHRAASIPSGGKLVELQVKNGKSWQTVRHPIYTRPNGKFKLHYRFGRFYVRNVHYRFRARVLRERDWPYKAPVSSRVRKLLVKAH